MSDLNSNTEPSSTTNGNELISHSAAASSTSTDKKNPAPVICKSCRSKVLMPDVATLKRLKHFLPSMRQKKVVEGLSGEDLEEFWMVEDMYHFENVGFSKAVDNIKYLICADCEMGPIGFHNPASPKEFYVATARVKLDY